MDFSEAFEKLLGHEGGYVNHRSDPGGETKYGISKRSYPGEDIKAMTVERAREIYLRDYWGPAGCDGLPDALKLQVFDMAVNSGVRRAIETLQKATGEDEDGVMGPRTLQAIQSMPAPRLVARFNAHRLIFMSDLTTWPAFGRGWAKRVALNLLEA
jgi:lysozyme family protein